MQKAEQHHEQRRHNDWRSSIELQGNSKGYHALPNHATRRDHADNEEKSRREQALGRLWCTEGMGTA